MLWGLQGVTPQVTQNRIEQNFIVVVQVPRNLDCFYRDAKQP